MNFFNKQKPSPSLICVARINPDTSQSPISYETHDISLLTTPPIAKQITPPTGDGVFVGDGSPAIGTYKWNKSVIKYCLVMPDSNNKLINIPDDHDLLLSVNSAFTKVRLNTSLQFQKVSDWTQADISIKLDKTDPIFAPSAGQTTSNVMAYCRFPGTTPQGMFTCVVNPTILYSETGKLNFAYNFNETILHEAGGHGTGCVHTSNPKDIMYPFYHNDLRPTEMDVYQWQFMYGARVPPVNPIEVNAFYARDATRWGNV